MSAEQLPEQVYLMSAAGPFLVDAEYVQQPQRFANALAGLINARSVDEEQTVQPEYVVDQADAIEQKLEEQLPLITNLWDGFACHTFIDPAKDNARMFIGNTRSDLGDFITLISSVYRYFSTATKPKKEDLIRLESIKDENERSEIRYNHTIYLSIKHARELLKGKYPSLRARSLLMLGLAAADTVPHKWDGTVPKKTKGETASEFLFRKSIFALNAVAETPQTKVDIEFILATKGMSLDECQQFAIDSKDQSYVEACNRLTESVTASLLMEDLNNEAFGPDTLRSELAFAVGSLKEGSQAIIQDPEIKETKWTILPAGTTEDLETGSGTSSGTGETQTYIDMERMHKLSQLAAAWGVDAYIAVANLQKSGTYDYRVAVLPQIINGVKVEHAVAENPSSGNAIFVYRAERGFGINGVIRNWKDVLSDRKEPAKRLGARRVLHNGNEDHNVLEYLTRASRDLDKPGYSR